MKKDRTLRLSLSRETLRTLAGPQLSAAAGGTPSHPFCLVTYQVSCNGTCNVICVAPGTTTTC
ncbi:MAG TPA: hypothetical protein VF173_11195 [Thermoanaerobaculia bacterium]|nr:hypothetical protein [Thermoanaerobaculia bacterium]